MHRILPALFASLFLSLTLQAFPAEQVSAAAAGDEDRMQALLQLWMNLQASSQQTSSSQSSARPLKPDIKLALKTGYAAEYGQPFPVNITLQNRGDITNDLLHLKVTFPDANLTLSGLPSECLLQGSILSCTLPALAAKESRNMQFFGTRTAPADTCVKERFDIGANVIPLPGETKTNNNECRSAVRLRCSKTVASSIILPLAASSAPITPSSAASSGKCLATAQCGQGQICTTELGACQSCCPPGTEVCIAACCGTCIPRPAQFSSSSSMPASFSSATLYPDIIYTGDQIPQPKFKLTVEGPTYGPVDTPYTLTAVVENTGDFFDQSTTLTLSWLFSSPEVLSAPDGCKRHSYYGGISGYPVYFTCPVPAITPSTPGGKISFPFTFQLNRSRFISASGNSCVEPTSMIFELKPIFVQQRTPVGNILRHQIGGQKVPLLFTHKCVSPDGRRDDGRRWTEGFYSKLEDYNCSLCNGMQCPQGQGCFAARKGGKEDGWFGCSSNVGITSEYVITSDYRRNCGYQGEPGQPPYVVGQPIDPPTQTCGNGKLEKPEWCDDGNLASGDGCYKCLTQSGYSCTKVYGQTSVCTRNQCGNGVVDAGENCDDGNLKLNDGCNGDCKVEYGFSCSVFTDKPSICSRGTCGNGRWDLYESCDDGNKKSGDGCSAACSYEYGWVCDKSQNPDVCYRDEDAWKPKPKY